MSVFVGSAAGLCAEDRVLEVGCGYGASAAIYAKNFQPRSITGIDITELRIAKGREYLDRLGLSHCIDLQKGDATQLAFDEAGFDKLIGVECAFHFDTRRDFLHEAARVLRPNGLLVLSDIICERGRDMLTLRIGEKTAAEQLQLFHPANAYDADRYTDYLHAAGFCGVHIVSILSRVIPPFILALHRHADATCARDSAASLHLHADRLSRLVEAGEDYVLVTARKTN